MQKLPSCGYLAAIVLGWWTWNQRGRSLILGWITWELPSHNQGPFSRYQRASFSLSPADQAKGSHWCRNQCTGPLVNKHTNKNGMAVQKSEKGWRLYISRNYDRDIFGNMWWSFRGDLDISLLLALLNLFIRTNKIKWLKIIKNAYIK